MANEKLPEWGDIEIRRNPFVDGEWHVIPIEEPEKAKTYNAKRLRKLLTEMAEHLEYCIIKWKQ